MTLVQLLNEGSPEPIHFVPTPKGLPPVILCGGPKHNWSRDPFDVDCFRCREMLREARDD